MARVGIVGTTSWGTTLAILLARNGHEVTLWARNDSDASSLNSARQNERFLPGVEFPSTLDATGSADGALGSADLVLIAVPSTTVAHNARVVGAAIPAGVPVVSAAKGLDLATRKRMSQLIAEELGRDDIGALSGPNLAREIAEGKPASATVASGDGPVAAAAQTILNSSAFRVYTSPDIIGVELGGALKNIVAIGAGFIDGLGLGNNAKAAFVTRGLSEITRLGVALGARPETFAGLSGMGDVIATCYSGLSRNRYVGEEIAKGRPADKIVASMDQTAEGVTTTPAAVALAGSLGVDMPIAQTTALVLSGELDARAAIDGLMTRAPAPETRTNP